MSLAGTSAVAAVLLLGIVLGLAWGQANQTAGDLGYAIVTAVPRALDKIVDIAHDIGIL